MLEKILPYEKDFFFLINSSHSSFMDCVMWLFSGGGIWIPAAVFLIFSIVYKNKKQLWVPVLIAIILLFICCDQFSSTVCKPFFTRLRPTHYPGIEEYVRVLHGYTGGKYGFISGHATNSFGFATLTTLFFRNKSYSTAIYIWALILSYSRIYLGVHFISDVLAGAIVGVIIAVLIYSILRFYMKKTGQKLLFSAQRVEMTTIVLASYILFVILFSKLLVYISETNLFTQLL